MKNSISEYMGMAKPFSPEVVSIIQNGGNNDYPNNDYYDLLVKDFALSQRHTFTLDGGSEKSQYSTSLCCTTRVLSKKRLPEMSSL